MDLLAQQYVRSFQLKITITRAFNHTGPRRGVEMATSSFASQIAMIEAGMMPPVISHGNLQARRDFTDVRDMVRAYWLAVNNCGAGEPYNICSGVTYTIGSVLDKLLSFSKAKPELKEDPARMRPSDVPLLLGSAEKFKKLTRWEPAYTFSQTLKDLLDYWREKLRPGAAKWHGPSQFRYDKDGKRVKA
jgi:GDP-4-dehydro-6-deoxy-D-mannose reductase